MWGGGRGERCRKIGEIDKVCCGTYLCEVNKFPVLFPQVPCIASQRKESILRCWAYGIASHGHTLVLTVEWGQETGYSGPVVTQPFLKWSQSPLSALNSRQSGVGMKGAARILSRRALHVTGVDCQCPSDLVPSSHLLHLTLLWGHGTASSAVVVSYDMSRRVSLLSAMGCTASLPVAGREGVVSEKVCLPYFLTSIHAHSRGLWTLTSYTNTRR